MKKNELYITVVVCVRARQRLGSVAGRGAYSSRPGAPCTIGAETNTESCEQTEAA